MEHDFYKELAKLRVYTVNSVQERSVRDRKLILADIDKELTRIANSIQKGYTLGPRRYTQLKEIYRPYKYFNITLTVINHPELEHNPDLPWKLIYRPSSPPQMEVAIVRGGVTVLVTDETIGKLNAWCKSWRIAKPDTYEECDDDSFYRRWW